MHTEISRYHATASREVNARLALQRASIMRAGRDREIHKALETVLALRGLSALTDAALEDLATQVVVPRVSGPPSA